jgi:hypothetical protein
MVKVVLFFSSKTRGPPDVVIFQTSEILMCIIVYAATSWRGLTI